MNQITVIIVVAVWRIGQDKIDTLIVEKRQNLAAIAVINRREIVLVIRRRDHLLAASGCW